MVAFETSICQYMCQMCVSFLELVDPRRTAKVAIPDGCACLGRPEWIDFPPVDLSSLTPHEMPGFKAPACSFHTLFYTRRVASLSFKYTYYDRRFACLASLGLTDFRLVLASLAQ